MASDKQVQQVVGAIRIVAAIGQTIQELGTVPAGVLFVQCQQLGISMADWQAIIKTLEAANLIEYTRAHLIRWVEPTRGLAVEAPAEVPDIDVMTWETEGGLPN